MGRGWDPHSLLSGLEAQVGRRLGRRAGGALSKDSQDGLPCSPTHPSRMLVPTLERARLPPRTPLLRPGSQGPRDQVWPGSPASPQQAALVCSFPSLPRLFHPISADGSSILPAAQATSLGIIPAFSVSHTDIQPIRDFLLALPSKYVRSPNISHRLHCRHPGQATAISLDYCHGLQPSPAATSLPGQGDPFIMSQMMSLSVQSPPVPPISF